LGNILADKPQSNSIPSLNFLASIKSVLADPDATNKISEERGESSSQVFDSLYDISKRFLASSNLNPSSVSAQAESFLGNLKSLLADSDSESQPRDTTLTNGKPSDFLGSILADKSHSESIPNLNFLPSIKSVLADPDAINKISEETGESPSQVFDSLYGITKRFLASSNEDALSAQAVNFLNNFKSILADSEPKTQQPVSTPSPKREELPTQKVAMKKDGASGLDFASLFDSVKSVLAQSEQQSKGEEVKEKEPKAQDSRTASPETSEPTKIQDCKAADHSVHCRQKLINLLKTFVEENW
jgi:hypothetical protein